MNNVCKATGNINMWHPVYEREKYLECMREYFEALVLRHISSQSDLSYNSVVIQGKECFMGYKDENMQRIFILFSSAYQFEEKLIASTSIQQRLYRNYNKRSKNTNKQ